MNAHDIEDAAQVIAETRRTGRLLKELPRSLTPSAPASGYAVQDEFRRTWGKPVAGWKIGATAKPVQEKFSVMEPIAGPFFAPDVMASPARPEARRFPHLCIESEFAFRLARAFSPRAGRPSREEVLAHIDAVIPAFELVGTRFDTLLFHSVATAIADCSLNAAFVLGAPVTGWRDFDYPSHVVRLSVDGKVRVEGKGANVLGDPLTVLEWAFDHLSSRGIALAPGDIVSTGTTTGLVYLEPGEVAVADFGPIGRVEVAFTGAKHPTPVKRA